MTKVIHNGIPSVVFLQFHYIQTSLVNVDAYLIGEYSMVSHYQGKTKLEYNGAPRRNCRCSLVLEA